MESHRQTLSVLGVVDSHVPWYASFQFTRVLWQRVCISIRLQAIIQHGFCCGSKDDAADFVYCSYGGYTDSDVQG